MYAEVISRNLTLLFITKYLLFIYFMTRLEPCAGRTAPPPTNYGCRRRLLMSGAPQPPTICRRAADPMLVFVIVFLHFSCFALFCYKFLHRCEIQVYTSLAKQFVSMSGL